MVHICINILTRIGERRRDLGSGFCQPRARSSLGPVPHNDAASIFADFRSTELYQIMDECVCVSEGMRVCI